MSWPLTGRALADFNRMLNDWKQYSTFPFIGPDDIDRLYNVLLAAGLHPQLEDVGNRPQYWLLQLVSQIGNSGGSTPPSGIHWGSDETSLSDLTLGGTFQTVYIYISSLSNNLLMSNCLNLSAIYFPNLVSSGGVLAVESCTSLTSVSLPNFLPANGSSVLFDGCALNETSVDMILARCVASNSFVSGSVDLSGGTNSPPSSVAPGSDYDILVNRGITVNVN